MSTWSDDPAEIKERSEQDFEIRWRGGHVSVYPYTFLRRACPCARCDEIRRKFGAARLLPGEVRPDVHPVSWDYVGRYALNFQWSDGHATGIYPYKMLREYCPCEECAPAPGS
ncbi:MAG: DUF971 domain-containing protein [Candidatus Xenobia bacterium]